MQHFNRYLFVVIQQIERLYSPVRELVFEEVRSECGNFGREFYFATCISVWFREWQLKSQCLPLSCAFSNYTELDKHRCVNGPVM